MSTTTETITRPPRAPMASVAVTMVAIVGALLLAPMTSAAAAEPLPSGTYEITVGSGQVTVGVAADGTVSLTASDGLVVQLGFDEDGRALDEFTVISDILTYRVEVEIDDSGAYRARVDEQGTAGDASEGLGAAVSTVARCAPTGIVARAVGLPNHGTIVSAAASGLVLEAEVTDPVSGEVTLVSADLSTLAGARDFCAQVDAAVPTLDEIRDTLQSEAAAARAQRAEAQQERAAARAALARARAAERAAQAATAGPDQRGEARPQDPGGSDGPDSAAGRAAEDDTGDTPSTQPSDDDVEGTEDTTTSETEDTSSDTDTTTGGDSDTTTDGDSDTTESDTGPGQGSGKPTDPGGKGTGPNG